MILSKDSFFSPGKLFEVALWYGLLDYLLKVVGLKMFSSIVLKFDPDVLYSR